MPTAKLSETDHERLKTVAEEEDASVKGIIGRLVDEYLDDVGSVVGHCPECGECFREEHVESSALRGDYVECPNKFESGRGEELLHSEGTGNFRNRFSVSELQRGESDDSADDPVDGEEGEDGSE
jgi:hypothetical protein